MLALCSAARLQPVGLDEHRLGIEPHRHVEIEPCGDLVTVYPVLSCFLKAAVGNLT
jgi:hypothetical protein